MSEIKIGSLWLLVDRRRTSLSPVIVKILEVNAEWVRYGIGRDFCHSKIDPIDEFLKLFRPAEDESWRYQEYRDEPIGVLTAVEVVPKGDSRPHISSPQCGCFPRLTTDGNAPKLIHKAFDDRKPPQCR